MKKYKVVIVAEVEVPEGVTDQDVKDSLESETVAYSFFDMHPNELLHGVPYDIQVTVAETVKLIEA